MSLLTMYEHIKTVLVHFPELQNLWETTYREHLVCVDIRRLLQGEITNFDQKNAFTKACEVTSEKAALMSSLSKSTLEALSLNTIATTLWNPLFAGTLKAQFDNPSTSAQAPLASTSQQAYERPKYKKSVKVTPSTNAVPKSNIQTSKPKLDINKPEPFIPKATSFVDTATTSSAPINKSRIYVDLATFANSTTSLYGHLPLSVKCSKPNCPQCKHAFEFMRLTSCASLAHPPCVPSGWFPHIGSRLWAKLKARHDNGSLDLRCRNNNDQLPSDRLQSIDEYQRLNRNQPSKPLSVVTEDASLRTRAWVDSTDDLPESVVGKRRRQSFLMEEISLDTTD